MADSIVVHRLSLASGHLTRLAAFASDGWAVPGWHTDGSITVPITESSTTVWYSVSASGAPPVRLGAVPRAPWFLSYSTDGLTVAATSRDTRPDVYLIQTFAELARPR